VQAKISTKTMVWSGAYILCFIIVHLLHLTTKTIHPEYGHWFDEAGRHDVYRMMIVGFRDPLMSAFYIVGMVLLGAHLAHGIDSLCQTLGVRTKRAAALLTHGGRLVAIALAIGYISIPTAILVAGHGKKYLEERQALEAGTVTTRAAEEKP
jgi:succinate dehydrogenase / fumarate reductase cytochrome b subunit